VKFKCIAVYILSDKYRGTLYTGVTANLPRRIWEHKSKFFEGFSSRKGLDQLVYFEIWSSMKSAILREKEIKDFKRWQRIELIESRNSEWNDLYSTLHSD
jgi:putative endonuclease